MLVSQLQISKNDLRVILETGFVLREAARFDEAEAVFRSAIELLPESEVPQVGLATVFLQRGDFQKAKDICEKAIQSFPESLYARLNYAEALLFGGQREKAEDELNGIILADPDSPHSKTAKALLNASSIILEN